MTGDELKAWRQGQGEECTQEVAALALGVSRPTIARAEAMGGGAISSKLAHAVAVHNERFAGADPAPIPAPAAAKPAKARASAKASPADDAKRQPRAYDFANAPAFTVGLARLPASNDDFKASPQWDARPASPGWQRIPGCIVICHASISDPLPFAPSRRTFGPRGVLTQSGAVYDQHTGHAMHTAQRVNPDAVERIRVAFQKVPKKAGGRR